MASKAAVRSPTIGSSTELASPTTNASPRSRRRTSSAVEPFPPLDSDETASSAGGSMTQVPHTTLLSSSVARQSAIRENDEPKPQARDQLRRHGAELRPQQSQSDRTDALWAEMQATLADVEQSASRGAHFFGSRHSAALEELRKAQMALAEAWTRGEDGNAVAASEAGRQREAAEGDKGDAASEYSPGTSIKDNDLAETDVEAARKRREANDRYFAGIQRGVTDVVEKLEGVAEAMGKVERESREIWSSDSDLDSLDS